MKKVKVQFLDFRFKDEESIEYDFKDVFYKGSPFTGIGEEIDGTQIRYVNGNAEGTYVDYHKNGQKSSKYELKNGEYIGEEIEWNEDGTLSEIRIHEKGNQTERWWSKTGVLIYEENKESKIIREWYLSGEVKSKKENERTEIFSKKGNLLFTTASGNYKYINLSEINLITNVERIFEDIEDSIDDEDIQRCFIKWLESTPTIREKEVIKVLEKLIVKNDFFLVRDCIRIIKNRNNKQMKIGLNETLSKAKKMILFKSGNKEIDDYNHSEIVKLILK